MIDDTSIWTVAMVSFFLLAVAVFGVFSQSGLMGLPNWQAVSSIGHVSLPFSLSLNLPFIKKAPQPSQSPVPSSVPVSIVIAPQKGQPVEIAFPVQTIPTPTMSALDPNVPLQVGTSANSDSSAILIGT